MAVTPARKGDNPDAKQRAADATAVAVTADGAVSQVFTNVTSAATASVTAGTSSSVSAFPCAAPPVGYLLVNIGGNLRKIPFYEA